MKIKRKVLKADKRKIFGRKVKNLRNEGILPANIYGKNIESTAVQIDQTSFQKLFVKAGETELLDLQVDKEKEAHSVLIRNVQVDPVTDEPLHVDFMQVILTEKVEAAVPIQFVAEAQAVKEGKGIFLELLDELEVEALPTDLPSQIEVDISGLKEVGDGIVVKELKLPKGVSVNTGTEELVCKIEALAAAATEESPEVVAGTEQPEDSAMTAEEKPATPLRPAAGGTSEGQAAKSTKKSAETEKKEKRKKDEKEG